ncbi:MAG TPA: hypothetical protein VFV98_08005 [Vicinamibacterales bacterium]|nr:hypothetical protein [Vicinamibacterales bacterium]
MACPKCQSNEVVDDVRVVDRGDHHSKNDLSVTVYQKPGNLVFKGTVYSNVTARVCGNCGYIELFAAEHRELLEAARARA